MIDNNVGTPAQADPTADDALARRNRRLMFIGAAVSLLIAVGLVAVIHSYATAKDPGVAVCEQVAASRNAGDSVTGPNHFTADEYQRVRRQVADSGDEELRTAGTDLVDLTWQIQQADGDGGDGMLLLGASDVIRAYSRFTGACAAHGVTVPPLGS